jgi:hypothetical protein
LVEGLIWPFSLAFGSMAARRHLTPLKYMLAKDGRVGIESRDGSV